MIVNVNLFTQLFPVPTPPHPAYLQTLPALYSGSSIPLFLNFPPCHLSLLCCYPFFIAKFPLTLSISLWKGHINFFKGLVGTAWSKQIHIISCAYFKWQEGWEKSDTFFLNAPRCVQISQKHIFMSFISKFYLMYFPNKLRILFLILLHYYN